MNWIVAVLLAFFALMVGLFLWALTKCGPDDESD